MYGHVLHKGARGLAKTGLRVSAEGPATSHRAKWAEGNVWAVGRHENKIGVDKNKPTRSRPHITLTGVTCTYRVMAHIFSLSRRAFHTPMKIAFSALFSLLSALLFAQDTGTLLLQQPDMNDTHIAFIYGADVWIVEIGQDQAQRITSTAAVESDPHLSIDGKSIAFTSDRSGSPSVYVVGIEGGTPERLTFHPAGAIGQGLVARWHPRLLCFVPRDRTRRGHHRIWSVDKAGGPETLTSEQWATNAQYSPDGGSLVIDRVRRWDKEWRVYRGWAEHPVEHPESGGQQRSPLAQPTHHRHPSAVDGRPHLLFV